MQSWKRGHRSIASVWPVLVRDEVVLLPFLKTNLQAYLFSPRDVRKPTRKRPVGERYMIHAYESAIRKACLKAGVPHWSPNRLRHNAGSRARKEAGLETAQVVLGHAKADVTQVYAERDRERAMQYMARFG